MRRRRARVVASITCAAALVGAAWASAAPASAAGGFIRYSITNNTHETLHLRGITGGNWFEKCINGVGGSRICWERTSQLSAYARESTIPPGATAQLSTARDDAAPPEIHRQLGKIGFTFGIGTDATDKVTLDTSPERFGVCTVHGMSVYTCRDTGAAVDFVLEPR